MQVARGGGGELRARVQLREGADAECVLSAERAREEGAAGDAHAPHLHERGARQQALRGTTPRFHLFPATVTATTPLYLTLPIDNLFTCTFSSVITNDSGL